MFTLTVPHCWAISIYQDRLRKSCLLSSPLFTYLRDDLQCYKPYLCKGYSYNISLLLNNSFFIVVYSCQHQLQFNLEKNHLSPNCSSSPPSTLHILCPCLSVTLHVSKLDVYCYPAPSWSLIEDAEKGLKSIQRNKLLLTKHY